MGSIDKELHELLNDPLLKDVSSNVALGQIKHLIQLEKGISIKLVLLRGPLESIELKINEHSTLKELKELIEQKINSLIKEKRANLKVNWKFIWSNNKLSTIKNLTLDKDDLSLKQLNLKNKQFLKFVKVKKSLLK